MFFLAVVRLCLRARYRVVAMARVAAKFFFRPIRDVFSSPVTDRPLPRPIQSQLRTAASVRGGSVSKYWVTMAQLVRGCNTTVRPGEKPMSVVAGSSSVYPLSQLSGADQKRLLDSHPAYFGVGVGIFTDGRWRVASAAEVVRRLNPDGESRVLYIDMDTARGMDMRLDDPKAVPLADHNRVQLYNACQAVHPWRVAPTCGLAINPTTGRLYPEPARTRLVAAGVALGYTSPMWVTEPQARKMFHVEIADECAAVVAPMREGHAVNLSDLPEKAWRHVLARVPLPDKRARDGVMLLLDCHQWEPVMREGLLREMSLYSETELLWVTLNELQALGMDGFHSRTTLEAASRRRKLHLVDLAEHTSLRLYNAENTTDPRVIYSRDRFLALVSGRPVSERVAHALQAVVHERRFLSPVWLTSADCRLYGVHVLVGESPTCVKESSVTEERVYNSSDVVGFEDFLRAHPCPHDAMKHHIFTLRWTPVHGVQRSELLSQGGYSSKLWMSSGEVALHSLRVRKGAVEHVLRLGAPGRHKPDGSSSGRYLYNAEQTSDPIKLNATARFLVGRKKQ